MKPNVETISCDFCNESKYTLYDSADAWNIVKCAGCGFHYTNPRPTIDSLPFYYSEEYFKDERHKSSFYNEDGTLKAENPNYNNRIMDAESFVSQRGHLLEIGAARGAYLHQMQQRGWKVDGVEISRDACDQAKKMYQLDLFCGTLDTFQTATTYDVICMYQTLEHVPNPKFILNRSYELLKPNGLLVIEVPNRACFEMKYSKERRRLSYDLPRHLNHFTPDFLENQLILSKFEIVTTIRNEDVLIANLLERRNQKSFETNLETIPLTITQTQKQIPLPLMSYPSGFKQKILQKINSVFPGWRFTTIARKK